MVSLGTTKAGERLGSVCWWALALACFALAQTVLVSFRARLPAQSIFRRTRQPDVIFARPPEGCASTFLHLGHTTTVFACFQKRVKHSVWCLFVLLLVVIAGTNVREDCADCVAGALDVEEERLRARDQQLLLVRVLALVRRRVEDVALNDRLSQTNQNTPKHS